MWQSDIVIHNFQTTPLTVEMGLVDSGLGQAENLFPVIVDGVVTADEHLAGKPAPDTYLAAARKVGAPKERAVVMEDARLGVAAGRAGHFGLVVGVNRGTGRDALLASGADVVVDDLAELAEDGP